jgi:hypothetical protein
VKWKFCDSGDIVEKLMVVKMVIVVVLVMRQNPVHGS